MSSLVKTTKTSAETKKIYKRVAGTSSNSKVKVVSVKLIFINCCSIQLNNCK